MFKARASDLSAGGAARELVIRTIVSERAELAQEESGDHSDMSLVTWGSQWRHATWC